MIIQLTALFLFKSGTCLIRAGLNKVFFKTSNICIIVCTNKMLDVTAVSLHRSFVSDGDGNLVEFLLADIGGAV